MINNIVKYATGEKRWFNYSNFYEFIAAQAGFRTFAEIGVWKGHSISFLASKLINRDNVEIYAVDLFDERENNKDYASNIDNPDYQLLHIYDMYNYNLEVTNTRHLIKDIHCCSWDAAELFEDNYFDFVFIDADHSYGSVVKDTTAWAPKVKKTGILAGHDYEAAGVRRAVHDICGDVISYPPSVWYKTECKK